MDKIYRLIPDKLSRLRLITGGMKGCQVIFIALVTEAIDMKHRTPSTGKMAMGVIASILKTEESSRATLMAADLYLSKTIR